MNQSIDNPGHIAAFEERKSSNIKNQLVVRDIGKVVD